MSSPAHLQAGEAGWPEGVKEVRFLSDGDQTEQPALFLAAEGSAPQPLVVFLHQWGGNYKYAGSRPVARWCLANNWNFIQPDFRGPNVRPEAMGSKLVLADIRSAVEFAKKEAAVDGSQVFIVGASGGGHAALLAAARLPGLFRAVSAWVPISDLVAWHAQCLNTPHAKYAKNIEQACGGALEPGSAAEAEARKRSPLTHLTRENAIHFDINAGIHDGHGNASVPVSHSFHAYNALVSPADRISDEIIEFVTREQIIPEGHEFSGADASYGSKTVLFRKETPRTRLTIFKGGHEMVPEAAMSWLNALVDASE